MSPLVMAIWSVGAIWDINDKLRRERQGQTTQQTRIATPVQEERGRTYVRTYARGRAAVDAR